MDGCDKPAKGNRFACSMHTERKRLHGTYADPVPRVVALCQAGGCERVAHARNLCSVQTTLKP